MWQVLSYLGMFTFCHCARVTSLSGYNILEHSFLQTIVMLLYCLLTLDVAVKSEAGWFFFFYQFVGNLLVGWLVGSFIHSFIHSCIYFCLNPWSIFVTKKCLIFLHSLCFLPPPPRNIVYFLRNFVLIFLGLCLNTFSVPYIGFSTLG